MADLVGPLSRIPASRCAKTRPKPGEPGTMQLCLVMQKDHAGECKFTPPAEPSSGDWTWREADGYLHIDGPLGTLAIVFSESRTPNGGRTGVEGDEGEANARLMSASPKLLAALARLVDAIPDSALAELKPSDVVRLFCEAGELQAAKAALKRARVSRG